MKMPDNLAEYEVLIKQYLHSIQEISEKLRGLNKVKRYWDMLTHGKFTRGLHGEIKRELTRNPKMKSAGSQIA